MEIVFFSKTDFQYTLIVIGVKLAPENEKPFRNLCSNENTFMNGIAIEKILHKPFYTFVLGRKKTQITFSQ